MGGLGNFNFFLIVVYLYVAYCQYNVGIVYLGHQVWTDTGNNSVKIIEGETLDFECTFNITNVSFTWFRNNVLFTVNERLQLQKVSIEDEGNYTCGVSYDDYSPDVTYIAKDSVYVKVLYPPSKPVINIPDTVLLGEELALTCLVKSDPEPLYQWRLGSADGLLLSRNKTFRYTVSYGRRIFCNVQSLMLPTFSDPKTSYASTYVGLNPHVKATITVLYPRRYAYYDEGDDLLLKCDGQGTPAPNVWWSKNDDDNFHVTGLQYQRYHVDKSDTGDYVCNFANTVTASNGTRFDVHRTEIVHVKVRAAKTNAQAVQLACDDCLTRCISNSTFVSTAGVNVRSTTSGFTTNKGIEKSINCTPDQEQNFDYPEEFKLENDSIRLILIITSVIGWVTTLVLIFIIIYMYKNKNIRPNRDSRSSINSAVQSQSDFQTAGVSSAYVTNVRISDSHYTDLTTYDQISSSSTSRFVHDWGDNFSDLNEAESASTQTSANTYMEPVSNQLHI